MSSKINVSHSALVRAARSWLMKKCRIVVSEMWIDFGERPDVIGWTNNGMSILIECKISINDFKKDQEKLYRRNGMGMGMYRWYIAPKLLLGVSDIPENWGFIEYCPSRHSRGYMLRKIIPAKKQLEDNVNLFAERKFLISTVYRAVESARLLKPIFTGDENGTAEDSF